MEWDTHKVDNAALALLYLTLHEGHRAWKSLDWEVMNRLHARGLIEDPRTKSKSGVFTPGGLEVAERAATLAFSSFEADSWKTLETRPGTRYKSADGQSGVLCRSAADNSHFFRVYQPDGSFEDYDLAHDELSIRIEPGAMAALYKRDDVAYLDHAPGVLGLDDRQPDK